LASTDVPLLCVVVSTITISVVQWITILAMNARVQRSRNFWAVLTVCQQQKLKLRRSGKYSKSYILKQTGPIGYDRFIGMTQTSLCVNGKALDAPRTGTRQWNQFYLDKNSLSGKLPTEIFKLRFLKEINLDGNKIKVSFRGI